MEEFKEILQASKITNESLLIIIKNENKMNEYSLNFQYFSAKKLLDKIRIDCKNELDEINKSQIDKQYLKSSIDRINLLCQASEEHFIFLNSLDIPKSEFVANYFQLVNSNINLNCKKNNYNDNSECNKFAILKSINTENLKDLPDSKLEFIESQLGKIYEEYKK
ncbi:hypothetical protein [Silvanigrella aquatica]|uniref:Uncharacterized protein n=1 Tax=Silvanigrella aquatica TaxID=1915309 RepID=A0A1L4CY57_9BACT|nr:hypothetical protein [Silvanigrella aquatica]APJ02893.1 hypothetical protein AXG55_02730 [Silvanigrella aquatica]